MDSNLTRLTVLFEAPFWLGIFERIEGDTLSVCKVTFGAEPKDYEVLAYVLKNHSRLRFSPSVAAAIRPDAANPKRMQRQIRKQTAAGTVGTRSQQALQLQREAQKKSSAALPAGSRNERKSTRANSPGAFFAAAHAFLYSPVISRCFFLGRAWRTRR